MRLEEEEAKVAVTHGGLTSSIAATHGSSECYTSEEVSTGLMEIDQGTASSSCSSGKRHRALMAGAIVSVFEGTATGICGSHATSYTARVIEHRTDGQDMYYIAAPTVESRQKPRKVPEYAVQEQKSFMSDMNQRKRGQMSSQQRKEKNKNRQDIVFLETELIKVRKNR